MGYTISSLIAAVICIAVLKVGGLPGILAFFVGIMAFHCWYRFKYGHWME